MPGARGLDGNSDADVVLHALCRALEQAIGDDAFSRYADEMSRNGIDDSREYVKVARANVAARRLRGGQRRPDDRGASAEDRAAARRNESDSVAALLGIPPGAVGINASTGEDLTAFGRGEGIQAFAIVSLGRERDGRGSAEPRPGGPVGARATQADAQTGRVSRQAEAESRARRARQCRAKARRARRRASDAGRRASGASNADGPRRQVARAAEARPSQGRDGRGNSC